MKGPLMTLKSLESKEALHTVLMERGLYRDVNEVIKKVEAKFQDGDFSEEAFVACVTETYGAKKPAELQSDEFLMRFIEVWIISAKEFKGEDETWSDVTSISANLFQNPLLGLVQHDASP